MGDPWLGPVSWLCPLRPLPGPVQPFSGPALRQPCLHCSQSSPSHLPHAAGASFAGLRPEGNWGGGSAAGSLRSPLRLCLLESFPGSSARAGAIALCFRQRKAQRRCHLGMPVRGLPGAALVSCSATAGAQMGGNSCCILCNSTVFHVWVEDRENSPLD